MLKLPFNNSTLSFIFINPKPLLIELLPYYFFYIPASSTGKYHPSFSLGEHGLVRHTKVAVRIAYELLNNNSISDVFNDDEKDLMLIALLLHDGCKLGLEKSEYTVFEHPLIVSKYLKENIDKTEFTKSEMDFICSCIETHMGEWTVDYKGNEVLEKPKNKVILIEIKSSSKITDDNEIIG